MAGRTVGEWTRATLSLFGRNWITLFGASLTTASALAIATFMFLGALNVVDFLYVGIVAFLILPGVFVFGLLLIPLGAWWDYRLKKKGGQPVSSEVGPYPTIDLNKPQVRRAIVVIGLLTFMNLLIISTVSYRGVVYMESPEFCGKVCHTVMEPEFVSYENSPHARVDCVECHIGPGAPWFVRSKLSGVGQVLAVTFHTYDTPIPTPVENLRPSQDTCEQCHWPKRFTGDRVKVITKFAEDETNTETKTVLLLHVGGAEASHGIHSWHIDPSKETTYYTDDPQRLSIPVVRVKQADGTVTEYLSAEQKDSPRDLSKMEARRMDCIDCHSRPTHIFQMPGQAMNLAMADGRIDKTLPGIRQIGADALRAATGIVDGMDPEAVKAQQLKDIETKLHAYYSENHSDAYATLKPAVEQAVSAIQEIYRRNIFPAMGVTWGTYRTHIGHPSDSDEYEEPAPSADGQTRMFGCFRCHDESHVSEDGRVISQDCTICHTPLAMDEENPEILVQLGLAEPAAAPAPDEPSADPAPEEPAADPA